MKIQSTGLSQLDAAFGPHLLSVLRAPNGTITIGISGKIFRELQLPAEDWHSILDKGYDILTRTFGNEAELARFAGEVANHV